MRLDPYPPELLDRVAEVVHAAFGRAADRVAPLGDGAFGRLFRVGIDGSDTVVKLMKYRGTGLAEHRALEALRATAPVSVPEPLAFVPGSDERPEALIMSYLLGESGRSLASLTGADADRVGEAIVDVLVATHAARAPAGFGPLGGPAERSWSSFFLREIEPYAELLSEGGFGPVVTRAAAASRSDAPAILDTARDPPVLVHGDFCLGNLLCDPATLGITGLIDPLDSLWGDRVLDLIHLTKSRGDRLRLLERYVERAHLDDEAMRRYWFYMFWRWVSYEVRIGVGAGRWLDTCARKLLEAIG